MIYFILALSIGSFRLYYFKILPFTNLYIFSLIYIISLIVILAETNRVPFDLPESNRFGLFKFHYMLETPKALHILNYNKKSIIA